MIIDGHHRYAALKELGYKKIPVTLINYFSDKIMTDKDNSLIKEDIIKNSERGNLYEPKSKNTSSHLPRLGEAATRFF